MAAADRTRRVRVLIVAPSVDILGGQAVQAARMLRLLREDPTLEVGFLASNPRLPGPLQLLQRVKYVRTVVTTAAYAVSLLARAWRWDVIHVFSASYYAFVLAPTPAVLIGRLYGRKVLLNYHSGEAEDHLRRWRRTALPVMRMADALIVPSEYLVRILHPFGLASSAIFNVVETATFRFRPRRPLRPVFLSNRNFQQHYRVDNVLRAFALVQRRVPEAQLTVAGYGPLREQLEQLAGELGLKHTTFVGRVEQEDIPALYDRTDIFLNGSEIDNQPLSILEAYASGLPLVTTDAGGIPDMVTHEVTGLMVPAGDIAGMAASAVRLLEDDELAQRLIANGRDECARYGWPVLGPQWSSCYHQLARR